ncbi:MAG TPA: hypothetical protein VG796_04120 [Verrucomicrobiales bacterium]|nr:hypothetical protein [Verrucomicrobiales bacterium]
MKTHPGKTRFALHLAGVLSIIAAPLLADQFHLRYEWGASPQGPFTRVPEESLRVHADGTATVALEQSRGFFRLGFEDGTAAGGGASVPIKPLSSVPPVLLEMLNRFVIAIAQGDSEESEDWAGAKFAPFVTPVTSVWNDTGEPDLVELKIIGPAESPNKTGLFAGIEGPCRSTDRGFILASLSRKSPPIVGYATDGPTQCETLLRNCQKKPIHCLRRFGPMFLAAEDADKNLIGNEGLYPAVYPDSAYEANSRAVSWKWDSASQNNPRLPDPPPRAVPETFSSYPELLEASRSSPWLNARRKQREALIEFDWLCMEGKAPTLEVKEGEEKSFLAGQTFTRFSLDDEEDTRGAVVRVGRAGEGVTVVGMVPGVLRLTLFPLSGDPHRYLIRVKPAGLQPRGGQSGPVTTSQVWEAGSKDQQPRYSQRADLHRWCDAVGCGPVMIAIQLAWAEHNQNVPSAYWHRAPGALLAARRISLREVNSPMTYSKGSPAGSMLYWYDYLHDACNVACWADGSGSTIPWDLGDALEDYVAYTCSALMPLQVANDVGGPLVSGGAQWENDAWGDDWDEAGVAVANAIKAGRPGGVYYMEHWHYCVAWRYRKNVTKLYLKGEVYHTWTERLFRVNTGWGDADRVWNAYDIDGCFLMNLHQLRELP